VVASGFSIVPVTSTVDEAESSCPSAAFCWADAGGATRKRIRAIAGTVTLKGIFVSFRSTVKRS
jgi:hypothetical protein